MVSGDVGPGSASAQGRTHHRALDPAFVPHDLRHQRVQLIFAKLGELLGIAEIGSGESYFQESGLKLLARG